jgi:hypothetical protein
MAQGLALNIVTITGDDTTGWRSEVEMADGFTEEAWGLYSYETALAYGRMHLASHDPYSVRMGRVKRF